MDTMKTTATILAYTLGPILMAGAFILSVGIWLFKRDKQYYPPLQ